MYTNKGCQELSLYENGGRPPGAAGLNITLEKPVFLKVGIDKF
jgi:hypothetical protein